MAVQYTGHVRLTETHDNDTAQPFVRVLGYRCFQIGCVIVENGLFNTTNIIRNLKYIPFGRILTQFDINFSRLEHQIDVLYVSFNQVSSHTPFHFSYTVPLRFHSKYSFDNYLTFKFIFYWHF